MAEQNPYVAKDGEKIEITDAGYKYLEKIVTDPKGSVYAFTSAVDPVMVAAAMARLSRSPNDLRLTYLNEFTMQKNSSQDFIEKVVAGYGDDSVKQLVYAFLVVESASNLLTKLLEWGRLAGYLEQSTRYIYFDQKNKEGNYRYYTPTNLNTGICLEYRTHQASIFNIYSHVVRNTTEFLRKNILEPKTKEERGAWLAATRAQACDAARTLLPVATQSSVSIVAPAQSVENLIYFLASHTLKEANIAAGDILRESKKVIGAFLRQVELPARGGAAIVFRQDTRYAIKKLVREIFRFKSSPISSVGAVTLVDYWPKGNELNILVPEMLFSEIQMPVKMIKNQIKNWPLEQKLKVFNAYIGNRLNRRHKPGRALEAIHYEWELFIDYGIFRDLQRHRMLDMPEWQKLTTTYGYEMPALIKEAGLEEHFHNCFRVSDDLFRILNSAGYEEEAQYATLLGHKMRFRFIENAREAFHLHELRTGPQGHPGYRKIVNEMHQKLCEVHPLIGAAMKFVNKGEDPELTRMAAELATQKKLALLEK